MKRFFQKFSLMSVLLPGMWAFPSQATAAAWRGAHVSYGGHFSLGGHHSFYGGRGYHPGVGLHLGFAFGFPIFNSAYYRSYWEPYPYYYPGSYVAPTVVVGSSSPPTQQIPANVSNAVPSQSPPQGIADPPSSSPSASSFDSRPTSMSSANRLFGR